MSFESPSTIEVLKGEWKPELSLDLQTNSRHVENDLHEVQLKVTVTVKSSKKVAFLAEVKQAGLFTVNGFAQSQLEHILGSFCPNILFPYAREAITDFVNRGGFPQLILAPVNFDALFNQHKQQGGASPGVVEGDSDSAAAAH